MRSSTSMAPGAAHAAATASSCSTQEFTAPFEFHRPTRGRDGEIVGVERSVSLERTLDFLLDGFRLRPRLQRDLVEDVDHAEHVCGDKVGLLARRRAQTTVDAYIAGLDARRASTSAWGVCGGPRIGMRPAPRSADPLAYGYGSCLPALGSPRDRCSQGAAQAP